MVGMVMRWSDIGFDLAHGRVGVDPPDEGACRRIEHVDDVVVPSRQPELPAVHA